METPIQTSQMNYTMPSQLQEALSSMSSLTKHLLEISKTLTFLRREFRGEALYQDDKGNQTWIQTSKPIFVKVDFKTNKPLMEKVKMPDGTEKDVYVANDEAIDEILSILKFAGVNQITPISNIEFDNYMDDLREFECKLAGVLCLKQREWGLDKELLPMMQFKIKTIVQDVRSMSVKGMTIKILQTTVQRVEQLIEGDGTKRREKVSPY